MVRSFKILIQNTRRYDYKGTILKDAPTLNIFLRSHLYYPKNPKYKITALEFDWKWNMKPSKDRKSRGSTAFGLYQKFDPHIVHCPSSYSRIVRK